MFKNIRKKIVSTNKKANDPNKTKSNSGVVLTSSLDRNISLLKENMGDCFDIKTRKFKIWGHNLYASVIYIQSLSDGNFISEHIIKPLTLQINNRVEIEDNKITLLRIKDTILSVCEVDQAGDFDSIVLAIMAGDTFLCIDGYDQGLIISTKQYLGRAISEPNVEPSIKGPKEAFVEILKDNIGLVRRKIRDPNLTFEKHSIGRRSKSKALIIYIRGITDPNLIDEVRKRLEDINIDEYSHSNQIADLISDNPNSIFPLVQSTERPDKLVSSIAEGRVSIMLEGSPNVLIIPVTLPMLVQSVDDYYEHWFVSSVIRFTRYLALILSTLLPAVYIAVTSFHPGLIPTNLALSIAGSRMGVPFPAFLEALFMELVLEILQEAGIRLPKVVGQTVAIVGGLVIGQSAVDAGIISPIMVTIIALTAISSFTIPDYSLNLATRILRIPFMILATIMGAYGIFIGILYLLGYICDLKSFGIGYMEPFTPYNPQDWKDSLFRLPSNLNIKRPKTLNPQDSRRQIIRKEEKSNEEE